jgi:hypothetical protein
MAKRHPRFLLASKPVDPRALFNLLSETNPKPPPSLPSMRLLRPLDVRRRMDWKSDLGEAIRVLQRHNKLLVSKFGINWVDATNVVMGEAQRRGTAMGLLARALVAGLRAEQKGGGA